MYPISTVFQNHLRGFDHEFLIKALIVDTEYDNTKIVDLQIDSSIVSSEEFEIGTAIPSKLIIRLRTPEEIPTNARIIPYLALSLASMTWQEADISWEDNPLPWIGGATEWMPLGEFYVDSREKISDIWVYTCYDKFVFADQPYISSLAYPTTQKAVFDEVCSRLGYTYDSSVVINPGYTVPVAPTGYSMRQVLANIAGANAASLYFGKNGAMRMKRYSPAETAVFEYDMSDYIRAKQTNPGKMYSRFVITYDTEDDLYYERGSGDENHTLYIENPFVTETIADAIYAALNGVAYLPIEMDSRGFPQLDLGDRIGMGLYEGTSWIETITAWEDTTLPWTGVVRHESYILHSTINFRGGLQLKLEAPSVSEQQSEFVVPGPLTEAINKLDKTALKEGKRYYGFTATREEGLKVQTDAGAYTILNADELSFYNDDNERVFGFNGITRKLEISGTLVAVDGIFSGTLQAVDGTFTGTLQAVDGTFTGTLQGVDGTFTGELRGGTVIGSVFRTGDPGVWPNVIIDPSSIAFGVYADENNGIRIPAFDGGVSKIQLLANGNESTIYNSPGVGLALSAYTNLVLIGNNVNITAATGYVNFESWSRIRNSSTGVTLQGELDAIWIALSGKANVSHSHSVNIPSHVHNPATSSGGGGTFTVS